MSCHPKGEATGSAGLLNNSKGPWFGLGVGNETTLYVDPSFDDLFESNLT